VQFNYLNSLSKYQMKITLLGTGGPRPDPNREGPSSLLIIGEEKILLDTGRGTSSRIVQSGTQITEIDFIFITHHHFDHISGLGDVIFSSWNKARNKTIKIFGPNGTKEIVNTLFEVYKRDIWYRLNETKLTIEKLMDIREIIQVCDVNPGIIFESDNWRVRAEYVDHGHRFGLSQKEWPCLAYRFESEDKIVTFSGDVVYGPEIISIAKNSDILVLCCYYSKDELIEDDLKLIAKYVLSSSDKAGKIAEESGVKMLILNHIREKPIDLIKKMISEITQDYNGKVIAGEDLMEIII
jgi:ribonuclease Z